MIDIIPQPTRTHRHFNSPPIPISLISIISGHRSEKEKKKTKETLKVTQNQTFSLGFNHRENFKMMYISGYEPRLISVDIS